MFIECRRAFAANLNMAAKKVRGLIILNLQLYPAGNPKILDLNQ